MYLEPNLKDKLLTDTLQTKNTVRPILSKVEKEILEYIAADMTSQQMSEKMFLSKRTIDGYRLGLLMKLGVKNPAGLVKKALKMGLID